MHQTHSQDILNYDNKALELRDRLVDYPDHICEKDKAHIRTRLQILEVGVGVCAFH